MIIVTKTQYLLDLLVATDKQKKQMLERLTDKDTIIILSNDGEIQINADLFMLLKTCKADITINNGDSLIETAFLCGRLSAQTDNLCIWLDESYNDLLKLCESKIKSQEKKKTGSQPTRHRRTKAEIEADRVKTINENSNTSTTTLSKAEKLIKDAVSDNFTNEDIKTMYECIMDSSDAEIGLPMLCKMRLVGVDVDTYIENLKVIYNRVRNGM